jgi:hypothetical protein
VVESLLLSIPSWGFAFAFKGGSDALTSKSVQHQHPTTARGYSREYCHGMAGIICSQRLLMDVVETHRFLDG